MYLISNSRKPPSRLTPLPCHNDCVKRLKEMIKFPFESQHKVYSDVTSVDLSEAFGSSYQSIKSWKER